MRYGRSSLRFVRLHSPRPRHQSGRFAHSRLPTFLQQALERHQIRHDERPRQRFQAAAIAQISHREFEQLAQNGLVDFESIERNGPDLRPGTAKL